VFVAYVEEMQATKYWVPSRIGLEKAHRFCDLFAGELYMSAINGSFKSILFPRKGELDAIWTWRSNGRHPKSTMYGFVGFNSILHPVAAAFKVGDKFKRTLSQEGINSPAQVVDVSVALSIFSLGW
jgi:hypothetical protein